jgi:hypothetical protein
MSYTRIVSAALAETQSKFKLAEALALDIPPKRRGPTDEAERSVPEYLADARQAIIDAGGEPRTVKTLDYYRRTALWVEVSTVTGRNFAWVPGRSFTAHNEARGVGMTYEAFAAMPNATAREIRPSKQDIPLRDDLTAEQKAAMARELIADPEVADAIAEDPTSRGAAFAAIDRQRERFNATHLPPAPKTDHGAVDPLLGLLNLAGSFIRIQKDVDRMVAMAQAHRISFDAQTREDIAGLADYLTSAGELLREAINGPSVDESIEALLNEGI